MKKRLSMLSNEMFKRKFIAALALVMVLSLSAPVSAMAETDYLGEVFGSSVYMSDLLKMQPQSINNDRFALTLEEYLLTDKQAALVYSFEAKTAEAAAELNSDEFWSEGTIDFAPSDPNKAQIGQWRNSPLANGKFDTDNKKYFLLQCENIDNKNQIDFYLTSKKIANRQPMAVSMVYNVNTQAVKCGDITIRYNPISLRIQCPSAVEDGCDNCEWNGTYLYFRLQNGEIKTFNQLYIESSGDYIYDKNDQISGWESFSWSREIIAPDNIKSIIINDKEYSLTDTTQAQAVKMPDNVKPFRMSAYVTDHLQLPLREFCNRVGADIVWDSKTYSAIVKYRGSEYIFKTAANSFIKDGEKFALNDETVFINKEGKMIIPIAATRDMGIDCHGCNMFDADDNLNPNAELHIIP